MEKRRKGIIPSKGNSREKTGKLKIFMEGNVAQINERTFICTLRVQSYILSYFTFLLYPTFQG